VGSITSPAPRSDGRRDRPGDRLGAGRRPSRLRLPGWLAQTAAVILEAACRPLHKEPPLSRSKLSFFLHSKPLSIAKARHELGFSPDVDFAAGIRMTLDWYRRNGWL